MKKIYLIAFLLSACLLGKNAMAQDERTQEKIRYIVEVDSQFIKASPYEIDYENGREIHNNDNLEWFTDMTVYRFLSKEINEKGILMKSLSRKPTIFLLSGGGFTHLDNQEELDPDNSSIPYIYKLAFKLTEGGLNNVIWIDYKTSTGDTTTMINRLFVASKPLHPAGCSHTQGTKSKTFLEYAALASFSDFRKIFRAEIDTNSLIDSNNTFVAGISAGSVLSIFAVFLEPHEIPDSLTYHNCNSTPTVNTIYTTSLKNSGYPIPKIKGIIPMSGGSLYNSIFNHTSHSDSVHINLMHGTCDELLNQDQGRLIYKLFLSSTYNDRDVTRYPHVYGSKYIYNQLLSTGYQKVGFGQVIRGGHNVVSKHDISQNVGAWDTYNTTNSAAVVNFRDIIYDNISLFMKRVMGEASPPWTNHAYSVFPDIPTTFCLTDDQTLLAPPIITVDTVCGTVAASVSNPPSWATITWTVSPNLQIVGSNTGAAISYKSLSTGNGWVKASVNYGGGVTIPVTKNVLVPITCPTPCNGILYYDNQTVGINTSIIHCGNIHSQNVKVNSGVSLVLDATGYVLIPRNFEVTVGATLSINP